jgi:hypothetical protein
MDGSNAGQIEVANGSCYANREVARDAVNMALPLIDAAMQDKRFGDSGFLHIVVMDPAAMPGKSSFEQAILHEHSVGDRAKWDADYQLFARAKAKLSWEAQCDSHALQVLRPHRLRAGDTRLWGSVCLDGIVVAVSGAFAPFDECYSGIVAMCMRALAKRQSELEGRQPFA